MDAELVFKAMADRTRHRILAVLRRHEVSVSEMVAVLQQPQSTISRHLKVLREAGLIRDRRNGATVLYSVVAPREPGNGADLSAHLMGWLAGQAIEPGIGSRLESVIQRRREMSNRFFDRVGTQWDDLREASFGKAFHLEAFWALLPSDWTVADIGTGTGYLLPTLARHFRRVIGVDPVTAMLAAARQRVEADALANVELREGDLAGLPLADRTLDLATSVLVLHHVPTPRDAVVELRRVLKDGGRLLIVEQTLHANEAFRERMQDRWWGFEPDAFRALVQEVGFVDVSLRRLDCVDRAADAPELFVVTARR